jgi:hypothetical protein
MLNQYGVYIGVLALIISILGLAWQYFGWILSIRKDMGKMAVDCRTEIGAEFKEIDTKLLGYESRLARVEVKMELFWNAVGDVIKNMIKQPTHFRKDELMDKLLDKRETDISNTELSELKSILHSELPELKIRKSEKSLAYALALAYIDQILYDRNCLCAVDLKGIGEVK